MGVVMSRTTQARLSQIIDEIGFSLYELGEELDKEDNTNMNLGAAVGYLAKFSEQLEQEKKYDFGRGVEIWVEGKEEWKEFAWSYILSQEKKEDELS